MVEIAKLMANEKPELHLSQIPLEDSDSNIRSIVSGNGLAQWVVNGCPDVPAADYGEDVRRFSKEIPLGNIMKTVEDFGHVLVTDGDHGPIIGILTYTDIIGEIAQR